MRVVGFCSVLAQEDNLGDVVIRREMLRVLRETCDEVVVYAGRSGASYRASYDLDGTTVLTRPGRFQARLVRAALGRERPLLVFAPGPARLGGDRRSLLKGVANLANVVLVRLGRGEAMTLGRAVRTGGRAGRAVEALSVRLQSLYVARDDVTRGVLGPRVRVAPDLALARDDGPATGAADAMVLSFRGDREVDPALVRRALEAARRTGTRPVLVTQVRRDGAQHARLAAEHGIEHVAWEGEHRAQLERVTATMRTARVVVSDRLHALLLGARNGAVVVPVATPGSDKLPTTLAVLPSTAAPDDLRAHLATLGEPVVVDRAAARAAVDDVRALVAARAAGLRGAPDAPPVGARPAAVRPDRVPDPLEEGV